MDPHAASMFQAHHCKCSEVTRCSIHTHPSPEVQSALNSLVDVMAEYDTDTGGSSYLLFTTEHSAGIFTSETYQGPNG